MTVRRAIVSPPLLEVVVGTTLVLPDEVSHYVRDVLRLREGAELELFDGDGRVARGILGAFRGRALVPVAVSANARIPAPVGPAISLLQGLGKGDKVDVVFRAATELGARRLVPVKTARAVVDRAGRADRWRHIVEDALRVSGRAWAPVLEPVRTLAEVLAVPPAGLGIALDGGGAQRLAEVLGDDRARTAVDVLVGPEGGFEVEERAALDAAGWARVTLGAHTLRTETAGPAIVAVLGHLLHGGV